MKATDLTDRVCLPAACAFITIALFSTQIHSQSQLNPSSEPIPSDYFGMHIHNATTTTPWPSVPVAAWRLWDARVAWPQLEPVRGHWSFSLLDQYLALAEQHGTQVLLPLSLSPTWASSQPQQTSVYQQGNAANPANLADWQNYVTTVVTHCKGRVQAYEIWNEPNSVGFWSGTVAQMVTLTQTASAIIHRIDPSALVVSPAATTNTGLPWLTQFLSMGGGKYVDVIAYHFYVAPQAPEAMVPLIQKVQEIMRNAGVADKPLWNTESGWQLPKPFPSEQLAAAYLTRAFILNWATGVKRFYWYAWDNHAWASIQTTEADNRTLTPAGQAFGMVQQWLSGAQLNDCDEQADHTWVCKLTRNGVPQWILWNPTQTVTEQRTYMFPQEWNDKSVKPMLGIARALNGAAIEVGQTPELVTSSVVP
jgi:hypothetical protein